MASACNKKAEGQTVAIVNGEEITAAELNAELANAKIRRGRGQGPGADSGSAGNDRSSSACAAGEEGWNRQVAGVPQPAAPGERGPADQYARLASDRHGAAARRIRRSRSSRRAVHGCFRQREQWNLDQLRFEMPTDAATRASSTRRRRMDEVAKVLTDARHRLHPAKEPARHSDHSAESLRPARGCRARIRALHHSQSGIRPSPADRLRASPRRSRASRRGRSPWPRCAASRRPSSCRIG